MALVLGLIILFVAFLGICTLVGLGTMLGVGRGKSSTALSMIGGGFALLAFFLLLMLLFKANASRDHAYAESSNAARDVAGLQIEYSRHTSPTSEVVPVAQAPHGKDAGETHAINISTNAKADPAEKEVEPGTEEVHNAPPQWLNQPPQHIDNIYRTSVTSDPMLTREECDASLSTPIMKTAEEYVDQLLGSGASEIIGLDEAEIREDVCKAEYVQKRMSQTVGVGEMKILHVLMEFDESFRNHVRQRYRQAVVQQRMVMAGGGALSVLVILGSIFGYLQIDTATKGYYSGRLKLVTAAVILAVVLLAMMLV